MSRENYHHYSLGPENVHYVLERISFDPYVNLKDPRSYDLMLHRTLSEIFHERCGLSSDRIKELLRDPGGRDSIIELILKKTPALSKIFPKERNKYPLLWIAVFGNYQKSAELLVRSGVDVNERCEETTILHLLLKMCPSPWNERFVGLVTSHGADLQARDSEGKTALHYAVYQRRVQATELLLENKADVNAVDNNRRTPLLAAAGLAEADELLPLLMKHGADVTCRDVDGENALHKLTQAPKERVDLAITLIEKGASLDDRTNDHQYQPIHLAAREGKDKLVTLFLNHGADVNALAHDDEFPLYLAASHQDPSALLTLLRRGANVKQKTTYGRTALHSACGGTFNMENTTILLHHRAEVIVPDRDGRTPLALTSPEDLDKLGRLTIKMYLLKMACLQQSVVLEDELMIKEDYPEMWDHYRDCVEEINKMKLARFIKSFTLFDLHVKCDCEIAALMRNREFEANFRQYDLNAFIPIYAKEVSDAFEFAKDYYESLLDQENVIDEAFYNALPHIVVRKVARYAVKCELCETTKYEASASS